MMHRFGMWATLMAGAMMLAAAHVAQAAQVALRTHTEVRHYAVSGSDELALLREMRRKGPRVGGRVALASTRMHARYGALLRYRHGYCRVHNLRMDVRFVMTLPRLQSHGRLRRAAQQRWPAFLYKLKNHERRHISIWKGCLEQVRRKLPAMRAASCSTLKRRMRSVYDRIMAQCNQRHDAFDRREKHAAASLPFIKAAFGLAHKERGRMQRH